MCNVKISVFPLSSNFLNVTTIIAMSVSLPFFYCYIKKPKTHDKQESKQVNQKTIFDIIHIS